MAKRSTQLSKEVTQSDEQLLLDNILAEGDSYEALKTVTSGKFEYSSSIIVIREPSGCYTFFFLFSFDEGGAHFQFKIEKSWIETDTPMNSRFQVQISSMNDNFSSIPFSERRNLYFECCAVSSDEKIYLE
jgi:hypothetical protein